MSRGTSALAGRALPLYAEHVELLESDGARFPDKKRDGSAIAIESIASGVEMAGRR